MPILRDITFIPLTSPDPRADFIDHQEATTLEVGREEVFEAAGQATGIVNENRKKPVAGLWDREETKIVLILAAALVLAALVFCWGSGEQLILPGGKLKGEAFRYDYNW